MCTEKRGPRCCGRGGSCLGKAWQILACRPSRKTRPSCSRPPERRRRPHGRRTPAPQQRERPRGVLSQSVTRGPPTAEGAGAAKESGGRSGCCVPPGETPSTGMGNGCSSDRGRQWGHRRGLWALRGGVRCVSSSRGAVRGKNSWGAAQPVCADRHPPTAAGNLTSQWAVSAESPQQSQRQKQ